MPKTNLKTLAYNKIRQKIVTCEYAPGTFLNEEILTEALGLSRTPIRDALSRLEQEGLIEIRPKRGIIVKSLTVSDVNMIFEVRNLYEPYILKNYGSLLPVERLHGFYDIFLHTDSNSECFKNNDYFYELDSDFHLMIVRSCPNVYIQNNYSLILTQNARFRYMTGNVSNNRLEDTFKEHLDIIRPCLQKNWDEAAEKMLYHLEESKKSTFQLIFDGMDNGTIKFCRLRPRSRKKAADRSGSFRCPGPACGLSRSFFFVLKGVLRSEPSAHPWWTPY